MAKTPKVKDTAVVDPITAVEEQKIPSYLQRILDNIPNVGHGLLLF